jgi:hypothetical protein
VGDDGLPIQLPRNFNKKADRKAPYHLFEINYDKILKIKTVTLPSVKILSHTDEAGDTPDFIQSVLSHTTLVRMGRVTRHILPNRLIA